MAITFALGTTALLESVMRPVKVAFVDWAKITPEGEIPAKSPRIIASQKVREERGEL
jgi:hypothetical protein